MRELLADLGARRDELRARNLIRLVDSCVRRLETTQEMVVTAATESAGRTPPALEADLAALSQELNASARWRRTVRVGGQRLQATAGAEVAKRIDALDSPTATTWAPSLPASWPRQPRQSLKISNGPWGRSARI